MYVFYLYLMGKHHAVALERRIMTTCIHFEGGADAYFGSLAS